MEVKFLILMMCVHFVADFICQTREMGHNKGKSIYWLTTHVLAYTSVTMLGGTLLLGMASVEPLIMMLFILITFSTHWVTDFVTSRIGGYFYLRMLEEKKKERELSEHAMPGDFHYHNSDNTKERRFEWLFWATIGFDQLIHFITLLLTYKYILSL